MQHLLLTLRFNKTLTLVLARPILTPVSHSRRSFHTECSSAHTHINEYTLHCKVILSPPWQEASGWHSVAGGGVWHLPPGTPLKWSSHTSHHAASLYWPPARLARSWDGLHHYYYHGSFCIVIGILMSWERLSVLKCFEVVEAHFKSWAMCQFRQNYWGKCS